MSWYEDFLIAVGSIEDDKIKKTSKRKHAVNKNVKKAQKDSFFDKLDKRLSEVAKGDDDSDNDDDW